MHDREQLQRRTLRVLSSAQVLAGLGGSGAAALALLAVELTGRQAPAGIPLALLVIGSSITVMPAAALARLYGRRIALSAALLTAAVGAAGLVAAGAAGSFALLCVASLPFGAGNAAVMLARYAAADLAAPERRGRAMGTVVFATTAGAVAGPNLLAPAGHVAEDLGLPALTGLFLVAAIAFALAAAVLLTLLRPDPLKVAAGLRSAELPPRPVPVRLLLAAPPARAGLAALVLANAVMVAVMAMAPVHLHDHGHGLAAIGAVVSAHIAGMFAPAPLTGWLTDRFGARPVALGGAALLLVAGVLAGAGDGALLPVGVGIALLGVGWNAALVAGSTLVAAAVAPPQRPRAEAAGELGMGVAAATASGMAAPLVGAAGFAMLAASGAGLAVVLGAILLALRAPPPAVPAPRMLG